MCCRSIGILWTSCGWSYSPWCISSGNENRNCGQSASESDLAMEPEVNPKGTSTPASVELPAPTAWPVVLAFGVALLFAGLLTSGIVSTLGAILAVSGCVGWFRQLLPHEQHESVPLVTEAVPIVTERREVARIEIVPEMHRARLPIEIYPIS